MFAQLQATQQTKEKIEELLSKMGLSKESIDIIAPFMVHIGLAQAGLLEKNVGTDVARQVYDLAMYGFLAVNPKVQEEMDAIMKDEVKRKHAIEVVLKSILETMKDIPEPKAEVEVSTEAKATLH
jgi:hypothetical protein